MKKAFPALRKRYIKAFDENYFIMLLFVAIVFPLFPFMRITYDYGKMGEFELWITDFLKEGYCLLWSFALSVLVPDKYKEGKFAVILVVSFVLGHVIDFTYENLSTPVSAFGITVQSGSVLLIGYCVMLLIFTVLGITKCYSTSYLSPKKQLGLSILMGICDIICVVWIGFIFLPFEIVPMVQRLF